MCALVLVDGRSGDGVGQEKNTVSARDTEEERDRDAKRFFSSFLDQGRAKSMAYERVSLQSIAGTEGRVSL